MNTRAQNKYIIQYIINKMHYTIYPLTNIPWDEPAHTKRKQSLYDCNKLLV